jgi:hypothetical protein
VIGRLRDERGFSLVFTLLTILTTSVTLTAAVSYTTQNSRHSGRSKADQTAYALAEAGLANGASVLSNPSNNALDPNVLPNSEPSASNPAHANYIGTYEGGTSKWWGVLTGHQWLIYGLGIVTDPTGRTEPVRRLVTSTIKIQPTLKQNLNSNAWNYMFAKNTGSSCDVTFSNSVAVDSSLYVLGDLCFENSSSIVRAAAPDLTNLYVGERIQFLGSGAVGTSSARINEARVGIGCRIGSSGSYSSPCSAATRVHADSILSGTVPGTGPTADFDFWYQNAKPGPKQFCTSGYSSGTSSTAFESAGSTTRNNSAANFNLTPSSNYTCRYYDVPPNQNDLLGELSWNNATKKLTVRGVIYIDGSAYISNNVVNEYDGLATLYLSGTFTISNSAQLCGAVSGGSCDFASWDPNTDNLGIIADGGGSTTADTVTISNSSRVQGSVYATGAVNIGNSAQFDGPMVAGTFRLQNSVQTHEFPTINSVPVGWPGNPTVYAEPQPPQNYSG